MIANLFKQQRASLISSFFTAQKSTPAQVMIMSQTMRYFSVNSQQRIYADRITLKYPTDLGRNLLTGPKNVNINKRKLPIRVDKQPIPLKDFINFKLMQSGNEILINLDNCDNLRNGELISAMIELGKRDKAKEHDWNNHPIV